MRTPIRNALAGRVVDAVWLILVWVALWGRASIGNVLAGALVAIGVIAVFDRYGPQGMGTLRLVPAVRYVLTFSWMLLLSNVVVVGKVLSPHPTIRPAVVVVDLPPTSALVTALVANSVTLTPGTLSLDAVPTATGMRLVVHALDAPDDEGVVADVTRLHRLACLAFGERPDPTMEDAS